MVAAELPKVAVIGTAGRAAAGARLNARLYDAMVAATATLLARIAPRGAVLVSGGAAYADHIAVRLSLRPGSSHRLRLCLPCPVEEGGFVSTGGARPWNDPGGTLNHYHSLFSRACGADTLRELWHASRIPSCVTSVHGGFEERNVAIAEESEFLVALTFGAGPVVADGGTWRTTKAFLRKPGAASKSYHIALPGLQVHSPAELHPRDSNQMEFGV